MSNMERVVRNLIEQQPKGCSFHARKIYDLASIELNGASEDLFPTVMLELYNECVQMGGGNFFRKEFAASPKP